MRQPRHRAGAYVKTWPEDGGGSTLYPSLPARVQLLTADEAEDRGIKAFRQAFSVIVLKQIPNLTLEDRIKWTQAGVTKYLSVVGVHNPSRIDELPVIDAAILP